ncbi:hypothetical protein ISS03_03435 [Patescibacteria group bacterium]|nr:hypothetical protein [Patescibacteria group bacterium]
MKSICFCGMDGAGKSTQSKRIVEKLAKFNSLYIHVFSQGNTVASKTHNIAFIKDVHQRMRDLSGKGIGRYVKILVGLSYYLVDAWVTVLRNRYKYKNNMIIYDRYFYDSLVIFIANFECMPTWALSFGRLLPKCNEIIFLEAKPACALKRKPEHSMEVMQRYFALYRMLAKLMKVEVVDGTASMELVNKEIDKRIDQFILSLQVI